MERDRFWDLIDAARSSVDVEEVDDAAEEVAQALVARLAVLPLTEIIGFSLVQRQLMAESYRWDLWAAAYLINGGCSDDGFDDFRGWLLTLGRARWDAAIMEPDSLADVAPPDAEDVSCEDMLYVARTAFDLAGPTDDFDAALRAVSGAQPARGGSVEPVGEMFDFDDESEMRRRLPRLTATFGNETDTEAST